MSERAVRRTLWLGCLLLAPVPVLLLGPGLVPPARMLMLGGVGAALMALESARGAALPLTLLLIAQALAWAGILWLPAAALARALARLPAGFAALVSLGIVAAGLFAASSFEIYHTPFAAEAARGSLVHAYR